MNNLFTSFILLLCVLSLSFFSVQTAHGMTEISGTVVARRDDSVKVEFEQHKIAKPKSGDKVEFSTLLQGIKVGAGTGEVTEVDVETVWVKISDDRPKPKMNAVIQATGTPSVVSKDRRDGNIENERAPLKKPSQAQDSSEESMSQQDIEKAVIQELIRLRYISQEMRGNVSADMLQASIDMCGMEHGFPSGRSINGDLLHTLRKLEPR